MKTSRTVYRAACLVVFNGAKDEEHPVFRWLSELWFRSLSFSLGERFSFLFAASAAQALLL